MSTLSIFASTVGSLNSNVSFNFLDIASFKSSTNLYFSQTSATPEYMAISSLFGSFVNTFGPQYSYSITSNNTGTPSSYFETKDVNKHLRDISSNQWWINQNISRFYDRYYTYSDGIASMVNDIKTYTVQLSGDQSATNVQLASLNSKISSLFNSSYWLSTDQNVRLYDSLGGNVITPTVNVNQTSPFYFRFYSLRDYNTDLYRITLPVQTSAAAYYNSPTAFSVKFVYDYSPYNEIKLNYNLTKSVNSNYIDLTFQVPPYGGFYVVITPNVAMKFYSDTISSPLYLPKGSLGYILEHIDYSLSKLSSDDIVDAINEKEFTAEVNIKNTINDVDLSLDVNLPSGAQNDTSNILKKLKDLALTGIAVNQLLNALDDADLNAWFSLSNKNVVEAVNYGYVDLYQ